MNWYNSYLCVFVQTPQYFNHKYNIIFTLYSFVRCFSLSVIYLKLVHDSAECPRLFSANFIKIYVSNYYNHS